MKRKLIGLIGYARAGKDTAAAPLIANGWTRLAFADQLKEDIGKAIGMPVQAMTAEQKEFWRPLLVEYGRARRAQHPDYWIWQVESALKMNVCPGDPVVITDVRYLNECHWVLDHGGTLVFVERKSVQPANREEEESVRKIWFDPRCEQALQVVVNNGDITHLQDQLVEIATLMKGPK
jgi:hypothetical protein